MAGHAPGARDGAADKGPKKSITAQLSEKLAASGIKLEDAPEAGIRNDNPFIPDAPAPAPAPPAGGAPAPADPAPGTPAPAEGAPPAAGAAAEPAAKPAEPAGGTPAPQTGAPAPAPAAGAPPAAPSGAAVVDSATGQPVAPGAAQPDLVDVEIDDPDTGKKFSVKVPKGEEAAAKGGWMRRADYTRKTQDLARWKKALDPLMQPDAQGYTALDAVLPYMNLANTSAEFARAMVTIANQITSGQPASYGLAPPAAAPAAGAAPAPPATVDGVLQAVVAEMGDDVDPLALDALKKVLPRALAPYDQRFKTLEERLGSIDQREQAQVTRQQQSQEQARRTQAFMVNTRAAFQAAYPAEFAGTDADFARLGQVWEYAARAGYTTQMDPMAAMFRAKADIDAAAREYTPSAGAAAVAAGGAVNPLDQVHAGAQARAAADAVAAGLGGGSAGGAATGGVQTGPNTNFAKRKADGKTPVSGKEFLKNFIAANPG